MRFPPILGYPQYEPTSFLHPHIHHVFLFYLLSLEGIQAEEIWQWVLHFAPPVLWWDEKWCWHPFFPLI